MCIRDSVAPFRSNRRAAWPIASLLTSSAPIACLPGAEWSTTCMSSDEPEGRRGRGITLFFSLWFHRAAILHSYHRTSEICPASTPRRRCALPERFFHQPALALRPAEDFKVDRIRVRWQLKALLPVAFVLLAGLLLFTFATVSLRGPVRHAVLSVAASGAVVVCAVSIGCLLYTSRSTAG